MDDVDDDWVTFEVYGDDKLDKLSCGRLQSHEKALNMYSDEND